ncbi:MAG: hypothetical protein GF355_02480 [Candidatus Eisenbacteria bacterium]|nr:hypothetical protein [Candidatus Eisenbacteria bacterium]
MVAAPRSLSESVRRLSRRHLPATTLLLLVALSSTLHAETVITDWGTELSLSNETYVLGSDLIDDGTETWGLTITPGTTGITILGEGHRIAGDDDPSSWEGGLFIDGSVETVSDVDIQNVCFEHLDTGIRGEGALCGVFIRDNRFEGLERGEAVGLHALDAGDRISWVIIRDNLIHENRAHPVVLERGGSGADPTAYVRIIGNTITGNEAPSTDPLDPAGAVRITGGGDCVQIMENLCSGNSHMSGILLSSLGNAGWTFERVKAAANVLSYHSGIDGSGTMPAGLKLDRIATADPAQWNLNGNYYVANEGLGLDYLPGSESFTFAARHSWWGDDAGPQGAFGDGVSPEILYTPVLELPRGLVCLIPQQQIRCGAWRSVDAVLNQDLTDPGLRGFDAIIAFDDLELETLRYEEGGYLAANPGGYPTQFYLVEGGSELTVSGAILGGTAPLATGNGGLFRLVYRALVETHPFVSQVAPQQLLLRDPDNAPINVEGLTGNSFAIDCQPPALALSLVDTAHVPTLTVQAYDNVQLDEIFYRIRPGCWEPLLIGGCDEAFSTSFLLEEMYGMPDGVYFVDVCAWDAAGNRDCETVEIQWVDVSGIEPAIPAAVDALRLTASPSPFAAASTLRLWVPAAGHAALEILGPDGRRVATLVRGVLARGEHAFRWDGCNTNGRPAAEGIYFSRLRWEDRTVTEKLLKIR